MYLDSFGRKVLEREEWTPFFLSLMDAINNLHFISMYCGSGGKKEKRVKEKKSKGNCCCCCVEGHKMKSVKVDSLVVSVGMKGGVKW